MEGRRGRMLVSRLWLVAFGVVACLSAVEFTEAATGEARVTRVVHEVKLVSPQTPARPASLNEPVPAGTTVQTGVDSQTDLSFADQTVARLAAKTAFSLGSDPRKMDLQSGAMLIRAPRNARGTEIRTANATVAVTGTTSLVEHNAGKYLKLVVLEGTARVFLPAHVGESVLVKEGQLLMFHLSPKLASLPAPVDVDIHRLMATSKLIQGFPPLGNEAAINQRIAAQKKQKAQGGLV